MAKKATSKPAAKAAKPAAVSTALPTSNESAQPGAEQGMATPLSPGGATVLATAETPPGVSGVLPLVAPLSEIVVTDPAGDAYVEGDIPPEIVVGSELIGSTDETPASAPLQLSAAETARAMAPALEWLDEVKKEQDAADAPKLDAAHPAIALAQRYQVGSGRPGKRPARYHTPEPPKLR